MHRLARLARDDVHEVVDDVGAVDFVGVELAFDRVEACAELVGGGQVDGVLEEADVRHVRGALVFEPEGDLRVDFPVEVEACDNDYRFITGMCRDFPDAKLLESNPLAYDSSPNFIGYVKQYNGLSLWQKIRLRGATLILFSRFLQRATPRVWTTDERMLKVLGYIHYHICDDIDIDALASVACITKSYLIRLFKQEFGISPLRYINRKKMEKSQMLLLTSNQPVKDVAYALGFNDHSYYIRQFKKIVGMTPLEYRQNMR